MSSPDSGLFAAVVTVQPSLGCVAQVGWSEKEEETRGKKRGKNRANKLKCLGLGVWVARWWVRGWIGCFPNVVGPGRVILLRDLHLGLYGRKERNNYRNPTPTLLYPPLVRPSSTRVLHPPLRDLMNRKICPFPIRDSVISPFPRRRKSLCG